MTLLDLQRRLAEVGRIRIGQQVPTSSGKTRPAKLSTFRLTSPDQRRVEQAAGLYGGTPEEWDAPAGRQWQVITEADALDVVVPPADMSFSQAYELWSGGGCQRRCDGVSESLSDGACLCDPEGRECKIHTRLSVMLRDLPGLGVWRIDTSGYYAAVELGAAVQVIQAAAGAGVMLPARLRLEQRMIKRSGEKPRRFAVPVLDIEVSPGQLMAGRTGALSLGQGRAGEGLAALDPGEPQASGLLTPVPESVPEAPVPSVAEQAAAVDVDPEPSRRRNAAEPVPPTGLAPRTVDQVSGGGGDDPPASTSAAAGQPASTRYTALQRSVKDAMGDLTEQQKADLKALWTDDSGIPRQYSRLTDEQCSQVLAWIDQVGETPF